VVPNTPNATLFARLKIPQFLGNADLSFIPQITAFQRKSYDAYRSDLKDGASASIAQTLETSHGASFALHMKRLNSFIELQAQYRYLMQESAKGGIVSEVGAVTNEAEASSSDEKKAPKSKFVPMREFDAKLNYIFRRDMLNKQANPTMGSFIYGKCSVSGLAQGKVRSVEGTFLADWYYSLGPIVCVQKGIHS